MRTLTDLPYGSHERNRLDLYLPDRPKGPLPLVVCMHGGGWTSGDKKDWAWEATRLAEAGLAAASLNYRLCPDWLFPAALDDVQRAVRWLRHRADEHGLDAARFGATGSSAGGHLAAFLALAETREHVADELAPYSSRVSCVVDCYGPVDLVAIKTSASAPIIERFLGKPLTAETVADHLAASPMAQVAPPVCPFLILHGTLDIGDTRGDVPIGISERFAARLRSCGGTVEFVPVEGGRHGFMENPENPLAQQAMDRAVEFFRRHLAAAGT